MSNKITLATTWQEARNFAIKNKTRAIYMRNNKHYLFYGNDGREVELKDNERVTPDGKIFTIEEPKVDYVQYEGDGDKHDPKYRVMRKATLKNQIQQAKLKNKTICLTISRVDCVVTELSEEFKIPILGGDVDISSRKDPFAFWCPFLTPTAHRCAYPICGDVASSGFKRCGKCKLVRYCSSKCQTAHWKAHKRVCL